MTLFLLSLAGIPPTGGFFGKFYLFRAAVERPDLVWLVVAAVLNSPEPAQGYASPATGVVLVLLAAVVLLLGVLPSPLLALVQ